MLKAKQREILELILDESKISTDQPLPDISEKIIMEKYWELYKNKDIKRAKRLYDLFNTPPDKKILGEIANTEVLANLYLIFDVIMKIQVNDKTEFITCIYNENNINKGLESYHPRFPLGLPRKINFSRRDQSHLNPVMAFAKTMQAITKPVHSAEELYNAIIRQKSDELEQGYRYSYNIPIMQSYNIMGEPIHDTFCITNIIPNQQQI